MMDEHATPPWLMKTFRGWWDPCPLNPHFNGLTADWGPLGTPTFANIPYSDPLPWIEKAIEESRKGKTVVLLVRVDTSTKWWLRLVEAGARFAFFVGRIKFTGNGSPNFASALVFL